MKCPQNLPYSDTMRTLEGQTTPFCGFFFMQCLTSENYKRSVRSVRSVLIAKRWPKPHLILGDTMLEQMGVSDGSYFVGHQSENEG